MSSNFLLFGVGLGSGHLFHLGRVTTSGCEDHDWVGNEFLTDHYSITLLLELILQVVGEGLVHLFQLFEFSFFNVILWEFEVGLCNIN